MNFNNKHIVFIILIIIIIIFIFNYDVYVIAKNQEICKPVYITKRDIESTLTESESESEQKINTVSPESEETKKLIIPVEKFKNLHMHENFDNSQKKIILSSSQLEKSIIPNIQNDYKKRVIKKVINVLKNIPVNLTSNIKKLLKHFGNIYDNSTSINDYYKNIMSDSKIKKYPYNSEHANLIIFLIDQYDNNDEDDEDEEDEEDEDDEEEDD